MSRVATISVTRDDQEQRPDAPVTAYERGIQVISLAMIASSTFMRADISIGIGSIYPAHVIAFALLPLAFWRARTVSGARKAVLLGVTISIFATVSSLSMPEPAARYRVLAQIVINAFTMLVMISLLSHLSRKALKQLVGFLCWLLFTAALAQAFLLPLWNARGTTTLGIPRPVLFFNEEGYVGLFAAFLFCAALALNIRFPAILAATLVVLADNRGAFIIAIAGALLTIPRIQSRRWLRNIVFVIPVLFSLLFVISALLDWSLPILNENSGLTRQQDTQAILRYNDYALFPWGGEVLNVFDDSRSRQIRDSINVWLIDLIWKFGLGGLGVFITWTWVFVSGIPKRIAPLQIGNAYWVSLGALFGLMADLQLNNPSGFSWMWVMLGLLYAIMSHQQELPL